MASSEKRGNPRVPLNTDVAYSLNDRIWSEAKSINISYHGILVGISEEISLKQVVHLVFELPNLPKEDPVEAKGEVSRAVTRRGKQTALAFRLNHLSAHHARAIRAFVDKMSP